MKIYTKTGDKGTSSLLSGKRVKKYDIRLETFGTIDELNAHIGVLHDYINEHIDKLFLEKIQSKLFHLGALLALEKPDERFKIPKITESDIAELEIRIDEMNSLIPELKAFVLAGGHLSISYSHVCRTVCRRAERLCVRLADDYEIDQNIVVFLNRLSDFFFVFARLQ